ncbi:MAG: NUDIX hydrolase [Pseudomonadota bacterium]
MDGKKPWRAAEIEALEEASAVGFISSRPIGFYHYDKRVEDGGRVHCRVMLYSTIVDKLKRRWKESAERQRHWFSPQKAAKLVEESELSELLKKLDQHPKTLSKIKNLSKAA